MTGGNTNHYITAELQYAGHMHAWRQWVNTLPSTCATKGVWDVIMDTLGIEPRAFRMRSGCDTTTPCARHSQLACAVAHWASRQLQVMVPWGLSPKNSNTLQQVLDTPGHTGRLWKCPGHLRGRPGYLSECPGRLWTLGGTSRTPAELSR